MKRILRASRATTGLVVVGLLLAGCGAGTTAHVAVKASHQRMTHLESQANLLVRDSTALRTVILAMKDSLHPEVNDVAAATASTRAAQVMASEATPTSRAALCDSVTKAHTDVENIAEDDQFLAGFVLGLRKTMAKVAEEASALRVAEVHLRSADSNSTPTVNSVSVESTIQKALQNASAVLSEGRLSADTGIRTVNSDFTTAVDAVNALISSTGCGTVISPPVLLVPS